MRCISFFAFLLFLSACSATAKERSFTGSTPAGTEIRLFLGMPLTDSVDFIRWQLSINNDQYHLHLHYGIGKPNTNGFMNDGKKRELRGTLKKEGNRYTLLNGDRMLRLAELNEDLLHLLDQHNHLLVGNGGWSYTLNSLNPSSGPEIMIPAEVPVLKDSMAFQGRTPCKIPGVVPEGKECYKLKWYLVLYADARKNQPTRYRILGTRWRKEGGITGEWRIVKGKNNRIVYQLKVNGEKLVLYLLRTDDNILVFTDPNGKMLVGDEDFSYTLNRVF